MFWRKLKFSWPLTRRGRYIVAYSLQRLFFSLNPSWCSLHSFAPQSVSHGQTCQIRLFTHLMGFCVAPFEWLSKLGFLIKQQQQQERLACQWMQKDFISLKKGEVGLRCGPSWLNTVVVSICSNSFLPTGHGCVAKCDSLSSRIVDELLTKSDFSQKPLCLFARNFLRCHFRSQRTLLRRFGAEIRNFLFFFLPIVAQDAT